METITEITFYKDFSMKRPFSTTYTVEFVNDKARVVNTYGGVFGMKNKSRLNKLNHIGQTSNGYIYALIVEGNEVFFVTKYKIYNK